MVFAEDLRVKTIYSVAQSVKSAVWKAVYHSLDQSGSPTTTESYPSLSKWLHGSLNTYTGGTSMQKTAIWIFTGDDCKHAFITVHIFISRCNRHIMNQKEGMKTLR